MKLSVGGGVCYMIGAIIAAYLADKKDVARLRTEEEYMQNAPYRVINKIGNYEIRRSNYNGYDYVALTTESVRPNV